MGFKMSWAERWFTAAEVLAIATLIASVYGLLHC